jgi:glycosyltransferase involved in cell wall biosynthesis
MRDEIAKAAVCVVPLRIGSGTRLKILEAAAMARPVVSTRLGVEGLDFKDGEEILLADDPRDFARAAADLLSDPERRRVMGQAARRRVEVQYSMPALRESLRRMLESLVAGGAPRTQEAEVRNYS